MESPRFIEPTLAMRAKLFLVAISIFAAGIAYETWLQPFVAQVSALSTCEQLPWLRGFLLVAIACCWLLAAMAYRQAIRILRIGQAPPPGTWVMFRTRVRTGFSANLTAGALFVLSALVAVGPLLLVATQRLYVIFCMPQSCGC